LKREKYEFLSTTLQRSTYFMDGHYIRTGRVEISWGKHYDWLFENRQEADYSPLVKFDPAEVHEVIEKSEEFVKKMEELVSAKTTP